MCAGVVPDREKPFVPGQPEVTLNANTNPYHNLTPNPSKVAFCLPDTSLVNANHNPNHNLTPNPGQSQVPLCDTSLLNANTNLDPTFNPN